MFLISYYLPLLIFLSLKAVAVVGCGYIGYGLLVCYLIVCQWLLLLSFIAYSVVGCWLFFAKPAP